MEAPLKDIITAYFNGGNATGKGSGGVKADLEAIRDFYRDSHEQK